MTMDRETFKTLQTLAYGRPWRVQDNTDQGPFDQLRVDSETDGAVAICATGATVDLVLRANAALIVESVNGYEKMRAALIEIADRLDLWSDEGPMGALVRRAIPSDEADIEIIEGEAS